VLNSERLALTLGHLEKTEFHKMLINFFGG
jgi:hypothetical protein